jgi:hypothetical protein
MLLVPIILSTLVAFAFAQGTAVPCSSFWPGVTPGDSNTRDSLCYVHQGTPEIIGTVNYIFAYETAWAQDPNSQAQLDSLATLVHDAMLSIVPSYGTLQNNIPDVVVILTTLSLSDEQADTSRPLSNGPCQVQLSSAWWEAPGASEDGKRMQTIAHEMYHCVQSEFWGDAFNTVPDNWVIESSAEYFSNVVFPFVNDEWSTAAVYRQEVAIFDNDIYAANIFFQSMEQAYGPFFINNWVKGSTLVDSPEAERTRLARLSSFADDFHSFGRQFTSGQIRDTSGAWLKKYQQVLDTIAFPLSMDKTSARLSLSPTTFTINTYRFELATGQTVQITYSSDKPNVRVSYMLDGDSVWIDMPGGSDAVGAEGTIVVQCKSEDQSVGMVGVLVLITATDDAVAVNVELEVDQTSQDENCHCPQSSDGGTSGGQRLRRRGLDRCGKIPTTPTSPTTPTPTTPPGSVSNQCAAVAGQPVHDACLEGKTWMLDRDAIEQGLRSQSLPDITIINPVVLGSGHFAITGTNATFTYTNFEIDMVIQVAGIDFPTKTVVNGAFEANFYIQQPGQFCLDVYWGEGSAVQTNLLVGGYSVDLGPGDGFVPPSYRVGYTCSADSLIMSMDDGTQTWGPYVYTI